MTQHFYGGITSVEISETSLSSMDLNVNKVLVARLKDCKFIEAYLNAEGFVVKNVLRKKRPKVMILKVTNSLFLDTAKVQHSDSSCRLFC